MVPQAMTHCCAETTKHVDDGEVAFRYDPVSRGYGIPILDGGSAKQQIHFCPWCGSRLPESLSDKWFEILDEMFPDFDGFADDRTPEEFKSDTWWKKRGF